MGAPKLTEAQRAFLRTEFTLRDGLPRARFAHHLDQQTWEPLIASGALESFCHSYATALRLTDAGRAALGGGK